jgi:hypothetical protein
VRNDKNSAPPANEGRPWDAADDVELIALLRQRKSLKQIANKLQRTEEGIFARMSYFVTRIPA